MYKNVTVLVRGFFTNLIGKPCVVVIDEGKYNAPAEAMKVEINFNQSEVSAADIIRRAYDSWKILASQGAGKDDKILLPSCIALCVKGSVEVLLWRDWNLDSAKRRLIQKDASPVSECVKAARATVDPAERANV